MRHLMLELDKLAESDQTELRFNPSPMCEPEPESLWHLTREKEHFSLVTLHPIEVARQITLITHSKATLGLDFYCIIDFEKSNHHQI